MIDVHCWKPSANDGKQHGEVVVDTIDLVFFELSQLNKYFHSSILYFLEHRPPHQMPGGVLEMHQENMVGLHTHTHTWKYAKHSFVIF